MAEWVHNGHECSKCRFRMIYPATCYEWIEQGDHGCLFKNYAVIPSECPACHEVMTAVVHEGGNEDE